jgi:hypothetical protein
MNFFFIFFMDWFLDSRTYLDFNYSGLLFWFKLKGAIGFLIELIEKR